MIQTATKVNNKTKYCPKEVINLTGSKINYGTIPEMSNNKKHHTREIPVTKNPPKPKENTNTKTNKKRKSSSNAKSNEKLAKPKKKEVTQPQVAKVKQFIIFITCFLLLLLISGSSYYY